MKRRWQVLVVPATVVTALAALPSITSTHAKVAPASELQMVTEGPSISVVYKKRYCKKIDPGNCIECEGDCKP